MGSLGWSMNVAFPGHTYMFFFYYCFRYFEKEQFSHSADKLALIGPAVTQFIRLTPGTIFC